MFQSLFRRAEVAIEHSVSNVITRVLIAVPFVIAAGFGIAALSVRLHQEFAADVANLIMAGLFLTLGLIVAVIYSSRSTKSIPLTTAATDKATANPSDQPKTSTFSDSDRELFLAALTSAAPLALPQLARMILRNLPILAVIAAAIFVMSRPSPSSEPMAPAE